MVLKYVYNPTSGELDLVETSSENIYNIDGILTGSRIVDLNGNDIAFDSNTGGQYLITTVSGSDVGNFSLSQDELSYSITNGTNGFDVLGNADQYTITKAFGLSLFSLDIRATGTVFRDTVNDRGIEYNSDYSANFTPRSLIDKAYVDSVSLIRPIGTVNTTNATIATVDTIDTLTNDTSHLISVWVTTEQDTNASGGTWEKKLWVTKRAGVVVIQQETNIFNADDIAGLDSSSVSFVVNAGNIDIKVTGIVATNYKWDSKYEIIQDTTN